MPSPLQTNKHQLQQERQRSFDLVVFGASGCVGRFVVEELALVTDKQRQPCTGAGLSWALAGRSQGRLADALGRAELATGAHNLSRSVALILADLSQPRSLADMCAKSRLVLNCAGPYSRLAEPLIKACIEQGTHYMDLCHESTFIERIRRQYDEAARRARVFVLHGCGFQAMSAEMGVNFVKRVADGRIDEVRVLLTLSDTCARLRDGPGTGIVTRAMWNSLLDEIGQRQTSHQQAALEGDQHLCPDDHDSEHNNNHKDNSKPQALNDQNQQLRRRETQQQQPEQYPDANLQVSSSSKTRRKDTQTLVRDLIEFRNNKRPGWLALLGGFRESGRKFCLPVNELTSDLAQLVRGEMNHYELTQPDVCSADGWAPIRCSTFVSFKSFGSALMLFLWLLLFNLLAQFRPTRALMRHFARPASLGHVERGPGRHTVLATDASSALDRDSLSHIKYCQTFLVYGVPGENSLDPLGEDSGSMSRNHTKQLLVARIVGPEPNRVATSTFAVQGALALLLEREQLPVCGGGVLSPGAAFADTNIIHQLRRRNIKFEVLKKA